ncbi:MAG: SDR family oxidoreductase [Thermaerobacter sp.]|nr:SDR family oxidoreductase [Thermaerobacter sp.]
MLNIDLQGKRALVTGASRGIGHQILLTLLEAGASCVGVARTIPAMTGYDRLTFVAADVSAESDLDRLHAFVVDSWGTLDILVNCAGFNIREPFTEITTEHFEAIFRTNLRGPFLMMKKFSPLLKESQGSIINITSLASHIGNPYQGAYAASKGGLAQLTKVAATELGPYNVRVNAVSPGYIETPLTQPLWTDQEFRDRIVSHTALRRLGAPEEIASVVAFLASPLARFITGEVIVVDGGYLSGDPVLIPFGNLPKP